MLSERQVNSRLIACDISERLGCWKPVERRTVWRAVEQHGADLVWQLAQDAIDLERVSCDTPRRRIFFDLLKQHRTQG